MNIQNMVELLAIAASQPDASEDAIYESLESAGVPSDRVDKLYKFTQIAWGRVFLNGMSITFSEDYYCLDADGSVIESGKLDEEPIYSFAVSNANKYIGSPAFQYLALRSSDVHVVNDALHTGAKPESLIVTPPIIFLAVPTDTGIEKSQELFGKHIKSIRAKRKKPWWKIWN